MIGAMSLGCCGCRTRRGGRCKHIATDPGADDGFGDAWATRQTGFFRWTQIYEPPNFDLFPFGGNPIKPPIVIGGTWWPNGSPIGTGVHEGYILDPRDYATTEQITTATGLPTYRIKIESIVAPFVGRPGDTNSMRLNGVGTSNGYLAASVVSPRDVPEEITGSGLVDPYVLSRGPYLREWPTGARWTIRITWKVEYNSGVIPQFNPNREKPFEGYDCHTWYLT